MKYTEKDKTKKDPLPYLYVSKASFEMTDHNTPTVFQGLQIAISFAAKYQKKDKEYKFKSDAEDYIDAFKMIIVEDIENYILEGTEATYGKATGLLKKLATWILRITVLNYFMLYYVTSLKISLQLKNTLNYVNQS